MKKCSTSSIASMSGMDGTRQIGDDIETMVHKT